MTEMTWPRHLKDANGPMRADKLAGAAIGMGDWGRESRALASEGWVPADMMTGLTLFVLGHQPKGKSKQAIPGAGGGVAGGVWVRERFTIVRPLKVDEVFVVKGESVGKHVHKGRRYGTNQCETFNLAGESVARNLTTGLLAYKVEPGLEDELIGSDPNKIETPGPDHSVAQNNPCLEQLAQLKVGQTFDEKEITVSLAMMAARDTKKPDNPIHSDPELARKAGLSKPIAGGSHVLSFPLEVIMQHAGRYSLFHGASFDIRWKAPVYADLVVHTKAEVVTATETEVVFEIEVKLESGATAMVGRVTVPLK
ncbi:MAG: acyl dehydratase [Candidatus Azotimanducaceae bacterium]|jgi:acyl dehydratase